MVVRVATGTGRWSASSRPGERDGPTDPERSTGVTRRDRPRPPRDGGRGGAVRGWFRRHPLGPWPLVLLMSVGLLPVALTTATTPAGPSADGSVADPGSPPWAYAAGILLVVVPAALGIAAPRVAARTVAVLSVSMAVLLQVTQVLRQPGVFVTDDDVLRSVAVRDLSQSGQLFSPTPLGPGLAAFPGLPLATTAVEAMTGWSAHTSALVLVVLVRALLAGSVLLLVTQVTRSPRIGALAVVLYAVNPQVLSDADLWSAGRFATGLAAFAAYLVVGRRRSRRASAVPALVALVAVAWVDQRTAVAVVCALAGWLVIEVVVRRGDASSSRVLGVLTAVAAAAVMVVALHASTVVDGPAVQDRPLVTASPVTWLQTAAADPGWSAALLTAAMVVTVLAVVVGLARSRWFVPTRVSLAIVLALSATLWVLVALAGVGQLTDLGVRAGGLLAIGAAVVPAWWFWQRRPAWGRAAALGAVLAVVAVGGAMAAPTSAAPTGQVSVADGVRGFDPEQAAAVGWMAASLPARSRVYADPTGRLLLALAGRQVPVADLRVDSVVAKDVYAQNDVAYVAADRRSTTGPTPTTMAIVASSPGVSTVYDNGSVVVYALDGFGAPR